MDHGLLMPFDLHSLRSKVEGRIEAVQNEDANSTGEYICARGPPMQCAAAPSFARHCLQRAASQMAHFPFERTAFERALTERELRAASALRHFSLHTCRCRHF